ncbi:MAG: glutathione S-transferase family protein [Paracoccaceae bacterium]
MLTLFHAPHSRSTALTVLLDEMGITDRVETRIVTIPRADGSGGRDPANPHPEGKVPALVHDGQIITERGAIILHLTSLFPESGMAPAIGTPQWGAFASWLTWYQGVVEPVLILEAAGISHDFLTRTFRGHREVATRISSALRNGPWLMGETYSAADLLVHSPYAWFQGITPDDPLIRDWVARCVARPATMAAKARDAQLMPLPG